MDKNLVLIERHGARAELTLNRPERRNALIGPLVEALIFALETVGADAQVKAVVLRGAGSAFCAGLDLAEFKKEPPPSWKADFNQRWLALHVCMFECPKPIVGALERYAIAGGSGLALACDFLVAGETSFLHVKEAELGMAAPMNVAWLQLRLGLARCNQLVMLAEKVFGPELVALGLAVDAVPEQDVLARTREVADRLASFPGSSHASTKAGAHLLLGSFSDAAAYFEAAQRLATSASGGS